MPAWAGGLDESARRRHWGNRFRAPKEDTEAVRWLEKVSIEIHCFVSVEDVDAALGLNLYSSAPYNAQEHELSRDALGAHHRRSRERLWDRQAQRYRSRKLFLVRRMQSCSFDYPSDSFVKVVVEVCISHRASAQKLLLKEHSALCTFATTERMLDPLRRMTREFFDGRRVEARKLLYRKARE